jgi:tetratricopeptide (TPR) repeat protein
VSRTVRAPASPPPATTAPTRAIAVPRDDPVVAALPFEARQTYLLARSELETRQWGFPLRLRQDAEDLIRAEPGFAPGHALRAIACTFRAVQARKSTTATSATPAIDGVEARQCARQSSQRALQLDPGSAQVLAASGLLAWTESQQCESPCDQRGLMDAAQASLEQAVRRDPSLPEARTWLGMVYQARGDLIGAAAQAEASVALDPLNPVATYNANNFRMARGEFAKVRTSLVAAMRRSDVPWFIVGQLVENALAAGDQQDALLWTRELARYGDVRTAQLLAAVAYARLEHPKEARSALAASGDGSDIETGEDLGYALWAHQLLDGSDGVRAFQRRQEHARREAARAPSEEDQRWWLEIQGLAYALSGEAARAVGPLEAVLGASGLPRMRLGDATIEADFANALAWAYRETGRPERAREVAEGALATLDRVAAMGFDHDGGFALTHALALELAGHRELAQFQASRAVARGRARPVDFNTDPRWHGLLDAGAVALADSAKP